MPVEDGTFNVFRDTSRLNPIRFAGLFNHDLSNGNLKRFNVTVHVRPLHANGSSRSD